MLTKTFLLVSLVITFSACVKSNVNLTPCPDGSECEDGFTCCKMAQGYGCCPYSNATCCKDLLHCCPMGYTCDSTGEKCNLGTETIEVKQMQPSIRTDGNLTPCPDGTFCADGSTCCLMAGGQYGCCPYPSATCCSDEEHCCPNGYTCDITAGTCNQNTETIQVRKIQMSIRNDPELSECTGPSPCSTGQTCCQTPQGPGCCPLPEATCCSDGEHCCPNGYTCDIPHQRCVQGSYSIPFETHVAM